MLEKFQIIISVLNFKLFLSFAFYHRRHLFTFLFLVNWLIKFKFKQLIKEQFVEERTDMKILQRSFKIRRCVSAFLSINFPQIFRLFLFLSSLFTVMIQQHSRDFLSIVNFLFNAKKLQNCKNVKFLYTIFFFLLQRRNLSLFACTRSQFSYFSIPPLTAHKNVDLFQKKNTHFALPISLISKNMLKHLKWKALKTRRTLHNQWINKINYITREKRLFLVGIEIY